MLLVFGLAVAAIAYKTSNVTETASAASCCCCSGDSCPMKKDAAGKDVAAHADCCKDGSCPMNKDAAGKDSASCCDDDCCKDGSCSMKNSASGAKHDHESCPMKKKEGEASHATMTEAQHEAMKAEGKSCGCACCSKQTS